MTRCRTIVLSGVVGLAFAASMAVADPLEMKTPPSKPDKVAPSTPDRDLRPAQPPVPYKPGFLAPLTKNLSNGRVGAAGWTAPNSPGGLARRRRSREQRRLRLRPRGGARRAAAAGQTVGQGVDAQERLGVE
jgi:hypothetical protein